MGRRWKRAGKWRSQFATFFKGKRIYIIPDRDEAGIKHGEQVARSLVDVAAFIRMVDLPDGVKDTADFAQANGRTFVDALSALLERARPFELRQEPQPRDEDDPTDYGANGSEPTPEECGVFDEETHGESRKQKNDRSKAKNDEWPKPQALEEYLLPVLPITKDMLPEPFATWAADIAYRLQCPLDFVAATIVVMTSSLLGTRCRIHPKRNDNSWEESPHLWGSVIGALGCGKTPAASASLKLLRRLQVDNDQALKAATDCYKAQAADYPDEVKSMRKALGQLRDK